MLKHKWIDIMKGDIITHGRIVGGGSEQNGRLTYHCADFVEWADGANVEAVFVGHTHQNHLFYDVDTGNMDDPDDLYDESDGFPTPLPSPLSQTLRLSSPACACA